MRGFTRVASLIVGIELLVLENFWAGLAGAALLGLFVALMEEA